MRLVFVLIFLALPVHSESFCATDLGGDVTGGLIAYLNAMVEGGQIGGEALTNFHAELSAHGKITNPLSEARTASAKIHRRAIDEYIRSGELREDQLAVWAEQILAKRSQTAASREVVESATQANFTPIIFLRLKERPIEVMQSLVTQHMWLEFMSRNPSAHGDRPENPVVGMDWFEAAEFANRLSLRKGLQPAYDFSKYRAWRKRTAGRRPNWDKPPPVGVNAPEGDISRAVGYRLPTLEEAQYLESGGAHSEDGFFPGTSIANINDYAWWSGNARSTQPVGQLLPFMVDDQAFYDLLGNASTWIHTEDTQNPAPSTSGSYLSAYGNLTYKITHQLHPSAGSQQIGLRLVRNVK